MGAVHLHMGKGVCYLKMPLRKYGHHHVFPKCASHVAGILENYGQTWVSNSVGKKKIGEGRVHQRSGEMKRSLRTTAWHCSSFSAASVTPLGAFKRRTKYTRNDSKPGLLNLSAINILGGGRPVHRGCWAVSLPRIFQQPPFPHKS